MTDSGLLFCAIRRSQWSGAKALAKLIKPRKESSRERGSDRDKEGGKDKEQARTAPDIPLPDPPPLLPPETPPPLPQRKASDTLDNGHAHSNHSNYISSPNLGPHSPTLTPINRGKHTHAHTQPAITKLSSFERKTQGRSYDVSFPSLALSVSSRRKKKKVKESSQEIFISC